MTEALEQILADEAATVAFGQELLKLIQERCRIRRW